MTRGRRWHFLQGAKVDKIPLPSLASHAPAFPVCLSDIRLGVLDGGPLNAGSFGPNALDNTFGPQVIFQKAPPAANFSPFAGLQFFGQVDIDSRTAVMTVTLKDIARSIRF